MADKKKQCFVVSPIGKDGSDSRVHADWLLDGIIRPVFAESYPDFEVVRADTISAPGLIDTQIIEPLLDAELVIADITTLNPNVFYEIGIRHVVNKPIVHMHLDGENIPFDISIFRSIPFSRKTFRDIEIAKENLKKALAAVFADGYKVDNPVTRTRGRFEFEKSATPQEQVILRELESLSARIAKFERFRAVPLSKFIRNNTIQSSKFVRVTIRANNERAKGGFASIGETYLPSWLSNFGEYIQDEDSISFETLDEGRLADLSNLLNERFAGDYTVSYFEI